jgi:SNF family Na+-dependent transporter
VLEGLGFVWNPRFAALADPRIWLAAAGQVFFTLGVGWGIVHAYASHMRPQDEVVLTGLSTASLNEFAEVVLGSSIALVSAVIFFGIEGATRIAHSGSFDLAFQAMPLVTAQIPGGRLFGCAWILLLFCAGITSSVAMLQPLVALLQERFGAMRSRAVALCGMAVFVCAQPVIFRLGRYMDQLDFWAGSFAPLAFGTIELVLFLWVFGSDRAWQEITRGARVRLPRIARPVITAVTPVALGAILVAWCVQNLVPELRLDRFAGEARLDVIAARVVLAAELLAFLLLVRAAFAPGRRPGAP